MDDKDAITFGVKKFFLYLYTIIFTLFTDIKTIVSIFPPTKSIPILSAAGIKRNALYLQTFQYNIRYMIASEYGNLDALSHFFLLYVVKIYLYKLSRIMYFKNRFLY